MRTFFLIMFLSLPLALVTGPAVSQSSYDLDVMVENQQLPQARLCGKPGDAQLYLRRAERCEDGERAVNIVLCEDSTGAITARGADCTDAERPVSRGMSAALAALLPPRRTVVTDDLAAEGGGPVHAEAINKCGQAACLCKGTFCADLIDHGYCDDFHCGGSQCICVFPDND